MNMRAVGVVLVSGCLLLGAGGCAKHEMVKKDEGIAPAAAAPSSMKTEVVKEKPVTRENPQQKGSTSAASTQSAAPDSRLQAALQTIYFDFDSYKLSDAARAALVKNEELLKTNTAARLKIEGNCDERGSDEYNLALGEKRAKVAMDYLVTLGLPSQRLSVISYGKEKPVDRGHTESAWAKNRRDDFVLSSN